MFLALRDEVEAALAAALETIGHPGVDLGLEEPPEGVDAVLASSVAFRLAGEAGAPPPAVADAVAAELDPGTLRYVEGVTAEGGYVNVTPNEAYYAETIEAARGDDWGRLEPRGESVVVEHTSANPTGPVHVGRARNPIIGDAIARLLDTAGYDVETHYYVNDAGRQIAVFVWAVERFDEDELPPPARDRGDFDLVRYYRRGSEYLETADPDEVKAAEAEIRSILQGLEAGDDETYDRVGRVVDRVLDGMRDSLARLPATFDRFVKETGFIRDGSTAAVADRLRDSDHAVLEDDAWQLDLSSWGIEKNLVFLRSDGTSLYTTRDLAHHEWKFDRFDRAVTVLGEDHKLQADQLQAALEILGNDPDRLDDVFYSWVDLPGGSMSTRAGTGVDLDDLLDEAVERARHEVESRLDTRIRDDDLAPADIERIARQVGIGAVRFDIVAKQPTKGITFEWEEALDFEAQSAPYVQYVHARCCGILSSAESPTQPESTHLETPVERELVEAIARFPAVIERAADGLEPHRIAAYDRSLAEAFNAFYRECPVLEADPGTREARLALVEAARVTVANGLEVLGVEAPTSM